jgi:hypothetical protein
VQAVDGTHRKRTVRHRLGLIILLSCIVPGAAAPAEGERSLAVTDPLALRALDGRADRGLGLARMLDPTRNSPITNDALFALPAMAPIRHALEREFARYLAEHQTDRPRASIGVGPGHDIELFDKTALTSPDTRFVLSGVVNRMDRAYVAPGTCGEMRLIYRLKRVKSEGPTPPRLPMTLNLVLRAKEPGDPSLTCAELARRWLASMVFQETGAVLADRVLAPDGPLASISAANIDRIETNLQIAHIPKSDTREFRTDYLQNVFRYDAAAQIFRASPMENQIDRDRLLADVTLGRAFKIWLLTPQNLAALDRGTILVPERYLATSSLAATPVGFARSDLQPEFGLMRIDLNRQGVFDDRDVVTALQQATASGVTLQNIRSAAGFARRLNDITCGGCHQTRGIGGFHFPGVDWMADKPSNTTTVPASPHFAGDQLRRRDIVMAMRDGVTPDFSRGFSDRPQTRGSTEFAGTSLLDGWGATCYRRGSKRVADKSFASWTCAEGLACQQVGTDALSDIGMCFVK